MAPLRVRYIGPFAQPTGYAQAAHEYLMALYKQGLALDIVPMLDCDTDNLDTKYEILKHVAAVSHPDPAWPTHVIVHTIPRYCHEFVTGDMAPPPGVKKIAITTWETQQFPAHEAALLEEHFDQVLVPSRWCQLVLQQAFIKRHKMKVRVLPHCYDLSFWQHPAGQTSAPPEEPFTFLWIGAWSERKNPIGVLKAYFANFREADKVLLRMVIPKGQQAHALQDIESLTRCMGMPDYPRVEPLFDRLTMDDVKRLHYASHCYVTASRGEAWGLGSFEAALVGNRVISPPGGHAEYLDHYPGWTLVEARNTPAVVSEQQTGDTINLGGVVFQAIKTIAPTGIRGDQTWLEPDLEDLGACMFREYRARAKWRRIHSGSLDKFSRERVGDLFVRLLAGEA